MIEKMRANEGKKGGNLQRGLKSKEEVVFRSLGGKSVDRKPQMNSEKTTHVYPSKKRMLKGILVCSTLCNLLHLVLSEHLQLYKDFHLCVGKTFSSKNGLLNK